MKISELQQTIEEIIIEVLSQAEKKAQASSIKSAQEDAKDATNDLRTNPTALGKEAARDRLVVAKQDLAQAKAMTEAEDEDDDSTSEKEPSKADLKKSGEKEKKEGSRLYQYQEELKQLEKELKDNKETSKKIIAKKENDRTQSDKNHLEKMSKITKRIKVLRDKMEVKL
jgi:hypothetical protein